MNPQRFEALERAFLVRVLAADVAGYSRRMDRRQPEFGPFSPFSLHEGDHSARRFSDTEPDGAP